MSEEQHPQLEILVGYLQAPGNTEFNQLRRHLIRCSHCRQRLVELSDLDTTLRRDFVPEQLAVAGRSYDVSAEDVGHFVSGRMSRTRMDALREQADDDPALFKSILHAASHSAAMQKALADETMADIAEKGVVRKGRAWLVGLLDDMGHRPRLVVGAISALLLVTLTARFLFLAQDGAWYIAAYQDDPHIVYEADAMQAPGVGFFSGIAAEREAFSGMRIQRAGRSGISFQWQQVAGAKRYQLEIHEFVNGSRRLVDAVQSEDNRVVISRVDTWRNGRYEWQLSGDAGGQRHFRVSGGFVIADDSVGGG